MCSQGWEGDSKIYTNISYNPSLLYQSAYAYIYLLGTTQEHYEHRLKRLSLTTSFFIYKLRLLVYKVSCASIYSFVKYANIYIHNL